MSGAFKDHFSAQAPDYARYRPDYPAELFAWLAGMAASRNTAWDCGTGSGQAARGLAAHFDRVIASDPSRRQLEHAEPDPKIEYRCASAEVSRLDTASADLITVAQAIHWFNLDRFYAEARRVLKPGGLLAVWTYTLFDIAPEIDMLVSDYYHSIIGPYWPPERSMVDDGYRSLPFPFEEIATPAFNIRVEWTLEELLGYLRTWSATQRRLKARGSDPCLELASRLEPLWPRSDERRPVRWPLHLRVGRA